MLSTASSRRIRPTLVNVPLYAEEFLYLPWLLPARSRRQNKSDQKRATSKVSRAAIPRQKTTVSSGNSTPVPLRRLATASFNTEFESSIPVQVPVGISRSWGQRNLTNPLDPSPKEYSASNTRPPRPPLIINHSLATRPTIYQTPGCIGDVSEIQATLKACLEVNQMDRAAYLLRTLGRIYDKDSEEIQEMHILYLEAMVRHVLEVRNEPAIKDVETWFNKLVRSKSLKPDAAMYALMIKLSLQLSIPAKVDRSVRRYMQMAFDDEYDVEVLNHPVLSDNDLFRVGQIWPNTFFANENPERTNDDTHPDVELDEVNPTLQKGLGLDALKSSLSLFNANDQSASYPENLEPTDRQRRLEADAVDASIRKWHEETQILEKVGVVPALYRSSIGAMMWKWLSQLAPMIQAEIQKFSQIENSTRKAAPTTHMHLRSYGAFLRLVPPERAAAVTIIQMMHHMSHSGKPRRVRSIVRGIGQALQDEAIAESIKKSAKSELTSKEPHAIYKRRLSKVLANSASGKNTAHTINWLSRRLRHSALFEETKDRTWTEKARTSIGGALLSMLVKIATIPDDASQANKKVVQSELQPAFEHTYQYWNGYKVGVINLNPILATRMASEPGPTGITKHLPMVCKPREWTDLDRGGYLTTNFFVLRIANGSAEQSDYARAAIERGDMSQIFQSLDILGQVPWRVNRNVLEVMMEAWNTGNAIADIPGANPQLEYPQEPPPNAELSERQKWEYKVREIDNVKNGYHTQRCFNNYQLEVARAFVDENFYFPHNVDFRGRAYPIPPYLNHMCADNARGLLQFANPRELGSHGLDWIKVHLANVFGHDKDSFEGRRNFTMEHLDDVLDSAEKPLEGRKWWLKAEDPWQCLAACFELKMALESPDPTKFKSSLPIHQDGSCNGLQHYAALGGDEVGAKQVNLEPGERPSDVYTAVSELVKQFIEEDASKGNKIAQKLVGNITRKVVKQTVMTNVYGVTFIGGARQIRSQLEDKFPPEQFNDNGATLHEMAHLITTKVFAALASMFSGAREIQFWLAESASRISDSLMPEQIDWIVSEKEQGRGDTLTPTTATMRKLNFRKANHYTFRSSVIWTTPLQMPVVQPYRVSKKDQIQTHLQSISLASPQRADPVDKRKQVQGFPPNFIHSLDATHMHLSAIAAHKAGLDFAAVHDSFWTHAGEVDTMNKILRDSFIQLHSQSIMERLVTEFRERYAGAYFYSTFSRHSEAGKRITAWRKRNRVANIKTRFINELILERQRTKLLKSTDEKDQEKGRQMSTPLSIIEELAKEKGIPFEEYVNDVASYKKQSRNPDLAQSQVEEAIVADRLDEVGQDEESTEPLSTKPKPIIKHRPSYVWLPLVFAPIPARGNFDVTRLRSSPYFFS